MELINRTTFITETKKFLEDTEAAKMEILDQPTKQKLDQVWIDNDENQEGVRVENNLMKDIKVKNQFLEEVKKQEKAKISYVERVKSRMRKYYKEKPFKISSKRRKNNIGQIKKVIKKTDEISQQKKAKTSGNNNN